MKRTLLVSAILAFLSFGTVSNANAAAWHHHPHHHMHHHHGHHM